MSDRIVVMSQGRIEQISAPYDLYTRPRTPFVAQFIGRNTILDGTVQSRDGDRSIVVTRFGDLAGLHDTDLPPGRAAKLVIPSEAFDVHPAEQTSRDALAFIYGGNVLPGMIERRDVVGHIVSMTVQLDANRSVMLEGHEDKYRIDSLSPSARVWIAWRPQEATVIAA